MNTLQKNRDVLPSSASLPWAMNDPRECDNHHHGFLFHWAFSARLPGDVESRPRGTPSRSRRYTFGHECSRVRRTHLSIHSDNHNNSGIRTTGRVQHVSPSSSLWQLHSHRILHTLQHRHTSHLHTRNRHLCASDTPRFRCCGH